MTIRSGRRSFALQVGATWSVRMVALATSLVGSVIVARALGPSGRGAFMVATTVAALMSQFGNLGLHAWNTYDVARDRSHLPVLVGNSLAVTGAFAAALVLLAAAASALDLALLPVDGLLLSTAVMLAPVALGLLLLQNLLLGVGDVWAFNATELGNRIGSVALIVVFAAVGWTSPEAFVGLGTVTGAVSSGFCLARLHSAGGGRPRVSKAVLRDGMSYGIRAYVAALAAYVLVRSDILIVAHYVGLDATGHYSIAVTMIDTLQVLPVVIGALLFPRLAAMADPVLRWRVALKAVLGTFGLLVAASIVAAVIARPAVRILYGAEFLLAVKPFWLMLPGAVTLGVNTILMNYFAATGMPLVTIVGPGLAAAANIGLNLVLVPRHGISAAAVTTSLCYFLMLLSSSVYLARTFPRA